MNKELDSIHHVAIEVKDIAEAVDWYTTHLKCAIAYQDGTWALLKFSNVSVALVLPGSHPPHLAIPCEHPEKYGEVKPHRDGTESVYLSDPFGNHIEMIRGTEII